MMYVYSFENTQRLMVFYSDYNLANQNFILNEL